MRTQGDRRHPRTRKTPWLTELVEGEPLRVAGHELVPLVRVTSRVRRRASLHSDSIGGQGYGFVHMRPVAILDIGEGGKRYQIQNKTARVIGWLVLIALLIPWIAALLTYLARRSGSDRLQHSSA